jgi:hypothetical protein
MKDVRLVFLFGAMILILSAVLVLGWRVRLQTVDSDPPESNSTQEQRPKAPTMDEAAVRARLEDSFGQMPLLFEENQGQWDEQVAYAIQGSDKTLYFTVEGVTFALTAPVIEEAQSAIPDLRNPLALRIEESEPAKYERWAVKLDFVGANPDVRPIGQEQDEAVISYFKGRPEEWHTGLPTYRRLVYHDLWPGIDLVYEGTVNRLKYHFVVWPGADPEQIRLAYRGAADVYLNNKGALVVETPIGSFQDDAPLAYQDVGDDRIEVSMSYVLDTIGPESQPYHFELGLYDPSRPLILDPAVLVYAGYIGGTGQDQGRAIAVDSSGNAYVTGATESNEASFPVTADPDLTNNGGADAFVAKIDPTGSELVYASYIGGSGSDSGDDIAVDESGNAYVIGETGSNEDSFPNHNRPRPDL